MLSAGCELSVEGASNQKSNLTSFVPFFLFMFSLLLFWFSLVAKCSTVLLNSLVSRTMSSNKLLFLYRLPGRGILLCSSCLDHWKCRLKGHELDEGSYYRGMDMEVIVNGLCLSSSAWKDRGHSDAVTIIP